jgi:hypothetical protein
MRHSVAKHDEDVKIDEGALGTTSKDHVPFASRYSPTLEGAVFEPVVPKAMHEFEPVHALE